MPSLSHIAVVGGSASDWARHTDERWWRERADEFGKVADHVGARWLSMRPMVADVARTAVPASGVRAGGCRRCYEVGRCEVLVDDAADGRQRLAEAIARVGAQVTNVPQVATGRRTSSRSGTAAGAASIAPAGVLTEAAITAALNDPAPCDPDLMLVVAPARVLPESVVWELAYSELVYVDVRWDELRCVDLERAIDAYAARERRFGGI